jgi:hypothetical protein
MERFFQKLPKGVVAPPSSFQPPSDMISSIPVRKRFVGRPPSISKMSSSIIENKVSANSLREHKKQILSATKPAERILMRRLQNDGSMQELPVIILAGEHDYDHCTIIDDKTAPIFQRRHLTRLERNHIRSECHVWTATGEHQSFRTGEQVHGRIILSVPAVAVKTVCNILTEERKNFDAQSGEHYQRRPTLEMMTTNEMIVDMTPNLLIPEEVNEVGRPFIFPVILYDTLKKRLLLFKNRTGLLFRDIVRPVVWHYVGTVLVPYIYISCILYAIKYNY